MFTLPTLVLVLVFGYSAAIIIGYVFYYQKKYAQRPRAHKVTIKALLGSVAEGDKTQFIAKQQKTMEIITETKKKISEQTAKAIPEQMTSKLLGTENTQEAELIKEGAKLLKQMGSSAEPVSEEQRKTDMEELLKAATKLEEMETDTPIQDVDELYSNVGYGLWMDTIAQGLRKITSDPNIRKHGMLQIEKLMSFLPRAFDPKDIRNALQLMKKSKEIIDLVELNPKTIVIGFTPESTELKTAEKVLLAATASEDEMTKQKVKMLFNWEDDFLNEVTARLTALNILQVKGDKLVAEGLLTAKDREYIKQKEAAKRASPAAAAPMSQSGPAAKPAPKPAPRPSAPPVPAQAAPKPVVNLPVAKVPPVPAVPGIPSVPSVPAKPQQPAKSAVPGIPSVPSVPAKPLQPAGPVVPAVPPVPGLLSTPAATPHASSKAPPAVPAIPKVAPLPPSAKPITASSSPPVPVVKPLAPAVIPAVKPLPAAKPIPPKTPALPALATKPVPASNVAPPALPSTPSAVPAKPTPPAPSLVKPSVAPLPAKPKPVVALPKPTPVKPAPVSEEVNEAPTKGKYVQIGDITPVNEAQRKDDMDDIMNAVMELEREASFSSGKEKANMQIFDKEGRAVDNESLLSQDKIGKPSAPEESTPEVEALAEKILAVYEKQEIVNGGVMQLKKLKSLLDDEAAGSKIDSGKLASTLEVVQSMGMISKIIDLSADDKLVVFKELELPADEIGIIQLAISTPIAEFTKENIVNMLGVPEEIVLATLKKLQGKGIIRFSGKSIQVPGVIQ